MRSKNKAKELNHQISAPSLNPKEIKSKVTADHIKSKFDMIKIKRNSVSPEDFVKSVQGKASTVCLNG